MSDEFVERTDRYRRELLAHCYRMMGSVHDAEDLVQETYLRAWRSYGDFEGRASLRTWLYRIATNACLNARERSDRRLLPTGLGQPSSGPDDPLQMSEVPWLEPVPDALVDPSELVSEREGVRLAFVAALQHLPARQRAVLVLRDVLGWQAQEVADAVGVSTAAVNSQLQRARAQLAKVAPSADEVAEPTAEEERALLEQYVQAFWDKDMPALEKLLTDDAIWQMPPFLNWYRGPAAIGGLIGRNCPGGPGDMPMIATAANGQRAYGLYMRVADGGFEPYQLQVLTLRGVAVSHVVAFFDTSLFPLFDLPPRLPPRLPTRLPT